MIEHSHLLYQNARETDAFKFAHDETSLNMAYILDECEKNNPGMFVARRSFVEEMLAVAYMLGKMNMAENIADIIKDGNNDNQQQQINVSNQKQTECVFSQIVTFIINECASIGNFALMVVKDLENKHHPPNEDTL